MGGRPAVCGVARVLRLQLWLALPGCRSVVARGRLAAVGLDESGPYAFVRHPIYLGWFVMVWATSVMTGTRFVFAATSCAYVLVAITIEERDLRRTFGAAYDRYMQRVRWKVLPGVH